MLTTQSVIETVAVRIERAYRVRRPDWTGVSSTPRVWEVVAETLFRALLADTTLPLDPVLYVASQACDAPMADPWVELTGATAVDRYRGRVAEIVSKLRSELTAEIRLAERRVAQGEALARVLVTRSRRISPLGRYVIARRAGRPVLAARFHRKAVAQHWACPLYRRACVGLLPDDAYPALEPDGPSSGVDAPQDAPVRNLFRWN